MPVGRSPMARCSWAELSTFNDILRNGIVRVNANGSLDPSFDPGSGFPGLVYAMALQPDGKLAAVGGLHQL
ncbi:MAG: delta-60 repeat domain-containing protein [Flavobacteriales bacterium]|nr:delta-60 repeat domain-containing protein [Flavobacteriales bacterium]